MEIKDIMQLVALLGIIGFGIVVVVYPIQSMEALLLVLGILSTYLGVNKLSSNSESV